MNAPSWIRTGVIIFSLLLFFNFFYHLLPFRKIHFWIIQGLLCCLYLFSLVAEYRKYTSGNVPSVRKYIYLPHSLWFRHALISAFFVIYGILMLLSGGTLIFLVPVVWTIALGEMVLFFFKKWSSRFYIAFYANYIDFHTGSKTPLFSREIDHVKCVRDIVYFFMKNGKVREIRIFVMDEKDQLSFKEELHQWIKKNNILLKE